MDRKPDETIHPTAKRWAFSASISVSKSIKSSSRDNHSWADRRDSRLAARCKRVFAVRLAERTELERCKELLDEHHYLGSVKAVGEPLHYVATDGRGQWLALLVFSTQPSTSSIGTNGSDGVPHSATGA